MVDFNINKNIKEFYKSKNVLLTGYNGFIGSVVAKYLSQLKINLILLDNKIGIFQNNNNNSKAKISVYTSDISSSEAWLPVLEHKPDIIFHLAAIEYDRINFNYNSDISINAISVYNLLESIRKKSIKTKIIFSSSSNVYGMNNKKLVSEKQKDFPTSLWSVHKQLAESYLAVYGYRYGIKSNNLRLSNVYGPSFSYHNNPSINRMILNAIEKGFLKLYSNKERFRDYIYVNDAAEAFLYLGATNSKFDYGGIFNVGSGERTTIKEAGELIAQKVKKIIGKSVDIEFDEKIKLEPMDNRNFISDIKRIKKYTQWDPKTYLSVGIEKTISAMIT